MNLKDALYRVRTAAPVLDANKQRLLLMPVALANEVASILGGLAEQMYHKSQTKRMTVEQRRRMRDHMDFCAWLEILLAGRERDTIDKAIALLDEWEQEFREHPDAPAIVWSQPRLNRLKRALLVTGGPGVVTSCQLIDEWRDHQDRRKRGFPITPDDLVRIRRALTEPVEPEVPPPVVYETAPFRIKH